MGMGGSGYLAAGHCSILLVLLLNVGWFHFGIRLCVVCVLWMILLSSFTLV